MSEAPVVYCPKEEKEVPVWYCLGSFTQGRPVCPHLIKATVHGGESAEVECKLDGKEAIEILKQRGMTQEEAEEFVKGIKRGLKARREDKVIPWSEVKKELKIK